MWSRARFGHATIIGARAAYREGDAALNLTPAFTSPSSILRPLFIASHAGRWKLSNLRVRSGARRALAASQ
jgi:hypothetical protein